MKKRHKSYSKSYHEHDDNNAYMGQKYYEKAKSARQNYLDLARDMIAQGDRVAAENCFQHADHYTRILNDVNRKSYNKPKTQESARNSNENQPTNQDDVVAKKTEENIAETNQALETA
ncbi:DUF4167 domain-containing protein [Rickettsiales endosymbiont of Stachyamoeba lipophora]|uniref:DUF4167 domain-containing protein n=1 Tax=Rickettsiales endosymbiont of Stachyamoeba lipophora TaxID=2486578 RepID=UPI000F654218|nr:DUF4167 domain-containing protein [Rickettsiales endosymbiont of Stachyamoeba lipophora]AZL15258.1 DUF4167 domain-containing protein [Rickettsiales endosymbiont of Stachyamoeba lipophora]